MAETFSSYYATLYTRNMVELQGYAQKAQLPAGAQLFAYLNYGGSTRSAKDALAEGMLALAVERGVLQADQPVVEATGSTFGAALTVAALRSGHPVHLVVLGNVSAERQQYLAELGAQIVPVNYVYGRTGAVQRATQLAEEVGGYFLDYLSSDDNPEYHRRVTGPAIYKAMDGQLDALVAGIGSGGTFTGTAEYLSAWAGNLWTAAVQPYENQVLTGGYTGRHGIDGIGLSFVPDNYNPHIASEVINVSTGDAKKAARDVLMSDGVPAGPSAGAVLEAATRVAKARGGRVVCIFNGADVYE